MKHLYWVSLILCVLSPKDPPLEIGDSSPRNFVVAGIDHPISFTQMVSRFWHHIQFRRALGFKLGLNGFWEVDNNSDHMQENDNNIINYPHRFQEFRNDIQVIKMPFFSNKHMKVLTTM